MGLVHLHMSDDTIDYAPLDKIQLAYSRRMTLEVYPVSATERVKQLFGITIQTALVLDMHRKPMNSHVILLCMFSDKPLYIPQRYTNLVIEYIMQGLLVHRIAKKVRQGL